MKDSRNESYFSKARVETFSDGIFAIIVTLLVLEIKVPQIENHDSAEALLKALLLILSKVLSWIVSFLIVCVIWVNHHRIFEQMKIITHRFFWLNANLLLWCSFIPFPTALMGDYVTNPVSLIAFGVILSLAAFGFYLMRLNLLSNRNNLNPNVDINHFGKATTRSLIFGPILYLCGAAFAVVNTYLSFSIFCFIPLYFIFNNSSKTND